MTYSAHFKGKKVIFPFSLTIWVPYNLGSRHWQRQRARLSCKSKQSDNNLNQLHKQNPKIPKSKNPKTQTNCFKDKLRTIIPQENQSPNLAKPTETAKPTANNTVTFCLVLYRRGFCSLIYFALKLEFVST